MWRHGKPKTDRARADSVPGTFRFFAELVDGAIVKQDDSWTKNRVIGTEIFIKKTLGTPHDPLAAGPPG